MKGEKAKILVVCLLALALAVVARARMRPVLKKRAGLPPFDVVREIVRGNDTAGAAVEGKLLCVWLADSDPALVAEMVMARPAGRMIAARNLRAELTAGAARSVDLGVRILHLPVLLITRSADSAYLRTVTGRPLPRDAAGKRRMLEDKVDRLVAAALKRYHDRVKSGRLVVAGSVFDRDGWYGRGRNRLVIVNINGERDPENLRRHPAVSLLTAEERRNHLGR